MEAVLVAKGRALRKWGELKHVRSASCSFPSATAIETETVANCDKQDVKSSIYLPCRTEENS